LDILAQVPGFGGLYFDRYGNLHAFLLDLDQTELAKAKLEPLMRSRPPGYSAERVSNPRVIIHQGRYDYAQLIGFRELATRTLAGKPGTVSFGIDHQRNRAFIGVRNVETAERVRAALDSLDVPLDAFTIKAGVSAEFGGR
jgi:hypothetical protein